MVIHTVKHPLAFYFHPLDYNNSYKAEHTKIQGAYTIAFMVAYKLLFNHLTSSYSYQLGHKLPQENCSITSRIYSSSHLHCSMVKKL